MTCQALIKFLVLTVSLGVPFDSIAGERKVEALKQVQKSVNPWTTQRFRSWTALRTRHVILQRLDFSCGAASIATLATFYMGRPLNEEMALRIIRSRYSNMDWKQKQKDGLSLEDLAYIARQIGLDAEGGRIGLAGLLKINGPVIVHLKKSEDMQHFSVLRGIDGMTAYLADPFFGLVPMSLNEFLKQFTGVVLAVWDPKKDLPSTYVLKLREQDTFYDHAYQAVRPSFYDRPRPIGPSFR